MRQWIDLFEGDNVNDPDEDMRANEFKSRRAEFGLVEKVEPAYDLQGKYDDFNKRFFDGALPTIPLSFAVLKNVGGWVKYKVRYDLERLKSDGHTAEQLMRSSARIKDSYKILAPGSMTMQLSSLYKKSNEIIDGILLHEMIHVYFIANGNVTEDHGTKFNDMRRKLTALSGIDIPLTEKIDGLEMAIAPKAVCVLVRQMDDGKTAFAIVNEKFASENLDALKMRIPYYVTHEFLFRVVSKLWTERAMKMKVQRSEKLNYFYVTDPQMIEDLTKSGRKLATLK